MNKLPDITQSALFMEAAAEARIESRRYWAKVDGRNAPPIPTRTNNERLNISARDVARALGGHVTSRDTVACPGPGHKPHDRSLQIKVTPDAPGGFLVHSFAGDDPIACRDYVRERLGLPAWKPERRAA